MSSAFDELLTAARNPKLPPIHLWKPERVGAIDIRIRSDGVWFHDKREIHRRGIAKVFSTILRKEKDGFYLVTPAEKLCIEVEDSPFVITDFEAAGAGRLQQIVFRTNLDDAVLLDENHPLTIVNADTGPRPYVHIRNGLDGRILQDVYYRLADYVEDPEADELAIWSCGRRFVV